MSRHQPRLPRRAVVQAMLLGAGSLAAGLSASTASAAAPHARWSAILGATVSPSGWVDYAKLRSRYGAELRAYLSELASATESKVRAEAQALWLNAYNAICVQTLIDHDLPKSVPHAKLFGKNIFTERHYQVAGGVRSLDEIEHDILRKRYPDPRLHAAIVCGASSCPRLRAEAYTGARLGAQLTEECQSWIQKERTKVGKRKNALDRAKGVLYASKIFDWYDEDFGGNEEGIIAFVAKYSSASDREYLRSRKVELEFASYDWSLNSAS